MKRSILLKTIVDKGETGYEYTKSAVDCSDTIDDVYNTLDYKISALTKIKNRLEPLVFKEDIQLTD